MADRTLTLDEALALLDKHSEDAKAASDMKRGKLKKKKVKDLLKEGAKQGRGGLNTNQSRLLDQIDN